MFARGIIGLVSNKIEGVTWLLIRRATRLVKCITIRIITLTVCTKLDLESLFRHLLGPIGYSSLGKHTVCLDSATDQQMTARQNV